MADHVPLPVLVSRVLGALTDQVSEPDDGLASLPVWSNVLRCVAAARTTDGVLAERDLAASARISTRLAIAATNGAARRGWLTADGAKRGRRALSLTEVGLASDVAWRGRLADLDEAWAGSALRAALDDLVGRLAFEHAWYPASYGTADPSVVGGSFVPARPGSDEPAHGQDWQPILRSTGEDTVTAVPITALLSQVLQAFGLDYESRPAWPLASTTLVVQHLSLTPSPLADVVGDHGITGNGKSLLERHGIATVIADPANPTRKLVQLTPLGEKVRSHHAGFVAEVEQSWRSRYGDDIVTALRSALEAHPAAFDPTLPDHVVVELHRV